MLLIPRSKYHRRCPDRLLFTHPAVRISRGLIHHVHQATSRPSFFKPGMETSIQLHQVTKVLPPRSPLPVCFPSPHAAPLVSSVMGNHHWINRKTLAFVANSEYRHILRHTC